MADTHEELLSDLLGDVAREDDRLEAPHLEARILASASLPERARPSRSSGWIMWPVAAAAVFAIAVTVRPKPDTTDSVAQDSTEVAVAESSPAPVGRARLQPGQSDLVLQFPSRADHESTFDGRPVRDFFHRHPRLQLHELQTELAERPARSIPLLAFLSSA